MPPARRSPSPCDTFRRDSRTHARHSSVRGAASTLIGLWLFALAAPSIFDSLIRTILVFSSRREGEPRPTRRVGRWLVLIPARDEGRLVEATVSSIAAASGRHDVEILLVLDGEDAIARERSEALGAKVVVKEPAGPTKGSLLRWVAENHQETLFKADAVMLLDVGSVLDPSFFDHFEWREGSEAMQAWLLGSGEGTGEAASASESLAQSGEDAGRERVGWNVRLRGTGTVLTPAAFSGTAPLLVTQVEDLEASLLLAAADARIAMAPRGAIVRDEKPDRIQDAAVQRSRWLAGKLEVFLRHAPALYALIRRHPLEGVAFVAEMLARPLALTVPFRLVAGAWVFADGLPSPEPWRWLLAMAAVASALTDVWFLLRGGLSIRGATRMGLAWGGALALSPRALVRWMRARR